MDAAIAQLKEQIKQQIQTVLVGTDPTKAQEVINKVVASFGKRAYFNERKQKDYFNIEVCIEGEDHGFRCLLRGSSPGSSWEVNIFEDSM